MIATGHDDGAARLGSCPRSGKPGSARRNAVAIACVRAFHPRPGASAGERMPVRALSDAPSAAGSAMAGRLASGHRASGSSVSRGENPGRRLPIRRRRRVGVRGRRSAGAPDPPRWCLWSWTPRSARRSPRMRAKPARRPCRTLAGHGRGTGFASIPAGGGGGGGGALGGQADPRPRRAQGAHADPRPADPGGFLRKRFRTARRSSSHNPKEKPSRPIARASAREEIVDAAGPGWRCGAPPRRRTARPGVVRRFAGALDLHRDGAFPIAAGRVGGRLASDRRRGGRRRPVVQRERRRSRGRPPPRAASAEGAAVRVCVGVGRFVPGGARVSRPPTPACPRRTVAVTLCHRADVRRRDAGRRAPVRRRGGARRARRSMRPRCACWTAVWTATRGSAERRRTRRYAGGGEVSPRVRLGGRARRARRRGDVRGDARRFGAEPAVCGRRRRRVLGDRTCARACCGSRARRSETGKGMKAKAPPRRRRARRRDDGARRRRDASRFRERRRRERGTRRFDDFASRHLLWHGDGDRRQHGQRRRVSRRRLRRRPRARAARKPPRRRSPSRRWTRAAACRRGSPAPRFGARTRVWRLGRRGSGSRGARRRRWASEKTPRAEDGPKSSHPDDERDSRVALVAGAAPPRRSACTPPTARSAASGTR